MTIKQILDVIPVVPFKGIDRFYDVNGLLNNIDEFKLAINMIIEHCSTIDFDMIGCIDARGFLFGPLIGVALNKPIFMIRKNGKMPNCIVGDSYAKEDVEDAEQLSISKDIIRDTRRRVILIDDLVATGGTLISAANLVRYCGGEVVECVCVIELSELNARSNLNIPLWSLISV